MKHLYKRVLLVLFAGLSMAAANAQTSVSLTEGGTLSTKISNPSEITTLSISGPMNDADYFWLRDHCPNLKKLDLSGVTTTSMPANALSTKASSDASLELTVGGQQPRYTLANGTRVIFVPKTGSVGAAQAQITAVGAGATVSPDPSSVTFTDGQPVTFTVTAADGLTTKKYTYYVTLDDWFTMVVGGDPELGKTITLNGSSVSPSVDNLTKYFGNIAALADDYSDRFTYGTYSYIKPKAAIVFSLGDIDADHYETDHKTMKDAFALITAKGIPMLTIFGNHDWTPESWGDGSYGCNVSDNSYNQGTVNFMKSFVTTSQSVADPISDVHYFTTSSGDCQPSPFVFRFHNVQFFMAGNYWFQNPYSASFLAWGSNTNGRTFYAPDNIISGLETYLANSYNTSEPAVWMQHFPLVHGSDIERWWMNRDANGNAPFSSGVTTVYGTYNLKLNKYKELIRKTKNPQHFSGHFHYEAVDKFSGDTPAFNDYVTPYQGTGGAYLVLMRESMGVMEVKSVNFNY